MENEDVRNQLATMTDTELERSRALRYKYTRSHPTSARPHQQGATHWSIDDAR